MRILIVWPPGVRFAMMTKIWKKIVFSFQFSLKISPGDGWGPVVSLVRLKSSFFLIISTCCARIEAKDKTFIILNVLSQVTIATVCSSCQCSAEFGRSAFTWARQSFSIYATRRTFRLFRSALIISRRAHATATMRWKPDGNIVSRRWKSISQVI